MNGGSDDTRLPLYNLRDDDHVSGPSGRRLGWCRSWSFVYTLSHYLSSIPYAWK